MTHNSSRASRILANYLLGLLGLGVLSAGCDGFSEDGGGSGGAGGSGGSGGTGGGENGDGSAFLAQCSPADITDAASARWEEQYVGNHLEYVCIGGDPAACAPADDATVLLTIRQRVEWGCGSSVFPGEPRVRPDHFAELWDVPCGHDPDASECCYVARVIDYDLFDMSECGRPFTVEGVARVAGVCARDDWRAELSPCTRDLAPETRRALAAAWLADASFEHASIASFARFALELLAVGAPARLVRGAQKAMADEIRHAELCFALAEAYSGAAVGPSALPVEGGLDRIDLAAIAEAAVREGCVGETMASLIARAAEEGAGDPAVRAALAEIATDEAVHAGLSWQFVAWAIAEGGDSVHTAVTCAFEEEAARVLAVGACAGAPSDPVMRHHGRLSPLESQAVRREAMSAVILPCARSLLARLGAAEPRVRPEMHGRDQLGEPMRRRA
ncbi:ferritin-like domain-containing protein [Sorangium sp. So ce388]|uniref:ferritin-like domain-containing protein n=1 Tax=Sorangium sp. So ce388 TaxID=3133309 RepID=UPI003F5B0D8D